ncbi:MAG: hypothetical protein QHI48_06620 [Bacteroidota bacterium]|nr:hypothetical protein [Bacteroidota bacterium]
MTGMGSAMVTGRKNIAKTGGCGKAFLYSFAFALVVIGGRAEGGFEKQRQGARAAGMGFACTALQGDAWALYFNPALIGASTSRVSAYVSPSPFGLSALTSCGVVIDLPMGRWASAAGLSTFGGELYRETSVTLGCALRSAPDVRIGVALDYHMLSIARYGQAGLLAFDLGVGVDVGDRVTVGASAFHVNQPRIGEFLGERLPLVLAAGVSARLVDSVLVVSADLQKNVSAQPAIRAGVEWRPSPFLVLRAGAGSMPESVSAGADICWGGVSLQYAVSLHPDLGWTHMSAVTINVSSLGLLP